MPKDNISMEERNDEWGQGCVVDGKSCFDCGECDDEPVESVPCLACKCTGTTIDGRTCDVCDGRGEL